MARKWEVLLLSAAVFSAAISCSSIATPIEEGRIAIIDVSESTVVDQDVKIFQNLKDSGVLVIGRYFARCQQFRSHGQLWRKRLIDGDPTDPAGEARAINAHFALMSIYQYHSDNVKKFTDGLDDPL